VLRDLKNVTLSDGDRELNIGNLMVKLFLFLAFFLGSKASADLTYEESRRAAMEIGKWLSKSCSHFDFTSASPISPKRAAESMFLKNFKIPVQKASDYGFSISETPITPDALNAYRLFGYAESDIPKTLYLDRLHLNWGIGNTTDFTFSYFHSAEGVRGWGAAVKRILQKENRYYLSYRVQIGRAQLNNYFDNISINQDLMASYYLRLVDLYVGLRHTYGKVNFEASKKELQIPPAEFFSAMDEIDLFYGIVFATTYNTRLTLQGLHGDGVFSWSAKFSFHFDSLTPTDTNWFGDPRAIKQ
jgi:hypothetical protein